MPACIPLHPTSFSSPLPFAPTHLLQLFPPFRFESERDRSSSVQSDGVCLYIYGVCIVRTNHNTVSMYMEDTFHSFSTNTYVYAV